MSKPKRVLVIGASGLLGHSLVPMLRQRGFEVVTHGHTHALDVTADVTEASSTEAMLRAVDPQAVINLVALTNVDRCEEQPNEAYRLNTQPVELLAAWAAASGALLIQISTDQLYDGPGPHAEDKITIANTYAMSKYAGELAARLAKGIVLRTNFFGPSRLADRPSFSDWILSRLRSRQAFVGFDDVLFSPLSMETLARQIATVLEKPVPGVFNLGSHDGLSKFAFAEQLARHFGLDASLMQRGSSRDVKLKAYRPMDMRMDCRRFEAIYGVQLPSLADEIEALGTDDAASQS
jgi:dTDP-4-dehydrorhamnose reductase